MKIRLLSLFNFLIGSLFAQDFYDRATVQKIEIFFAFTNWDAQLDAATATEVPRCQTCIAELRTGLL